MKTTDEDILMTALELFAQRGFDGVSTSMIAERLGITKGALYRHFESKQAIFDAIIQRMFELDAQQAQGSGVPVEEFADNPEAYAATALADLCGFVGAQLVFWTQHPFASLFRRMITISQFASPDLGKLYQDVIAAGPARYTEDLFRQMQENGQLNAAAAALGPWNLALELFAPLQLSIQLVDGGADPARVAADLQTVTAAFQARYAAADGAR